MTMASCSKACKYAVGFGNEKVQRIKVALLALAAAMTCDRSNCEKVRLRHLEFAILCRRIGIDIDSDGIISDLQQIGVDGEKAFKTKKMLSPLDI